jgi:hypothetical protein
VIAVAGVKVQVREVGVDDGRDRLAGPSLRESDVGGTGRRRDDEATQRQGQSDSSCGPTNGPGRSTFRARSPEGASRPESHIGCCHPFLTETRRTETVNTGRPAKPAARSVPRPSLRLMALSALERERFLAEPHVAALSVSAGPDRGPLTVPIWYQYTPGGEVWVLTSPGSRKARLIEQAGRFSLMVDRVEPSARHVSVEGPTTRTIPRTDELLLEMTQRYLPPDKVQAYVDYAKTELADEVVVYLQPQHWLSADLGAW